MNTKATTIFHALLVWLAGLGVCAAQVTMQVAMMATEPPLCPSHAHLAPSYSLVANATGFGWTKTR